MFIESLKILYIGGVIRDLKFKPGLNLVIDDTPSDKTKSTGNNVGKTTVLKLIDFCLGANPSIVYKDSENKNDKYRLVQEFLTNYEVEIRLSLVDDFFAENPNRIEVRRNFLTGKKNIRTINGEKVLEKDFEKKLFELLYPNCTFDKPTFRQLISHNIRYKDESINNTLKVLDKYTTDVEYETLYLYMLGCSFDKGAEKQALFTKIKQEEAFKNKLELKQTKNAYEVALSLLNDEIDKLDFAKTNLNINPDLESELDQLNLIKLKINKASSDISKMKLRKNLIEESKKEIENSSFSIDMEQLKELYLDVNKNIINLQKTFEDVVNYHNNMVTEKSKFITSELPLITRNIEELEFSMAGFLKEERSLSEKVTKSDTFDDLENIISQLNEKFRLKGEYESMISQLEESEKNIDNLKREMEGIDKDLFSEFFEKNLKTQIAKFNKIFSSISEELYGERYALKHDITVNKKGRSVYEFSAFNANMSSGKKQGEILCFDLAYIIFATQEKIPNLKFLLNDKKELMHDNQLIKMADFVKGRNIQLIVSILRDKLPTQVLTDTHIAVELSQEDKLFKIEEITKNFNIDF